MAIEPAQTQQAQPDSDIPESVDDPTTANPTSVAGDPTMVPSHLPEAHALAYEPASEPMPHVEHTYEPGNFTCVRCGSRNLADGYVVDYGDKFEQIHFAPKRITLRWLNSLLALRPWRSLATMSAVACRDCGAVLLTVNPSELRRAEHRRDESE